MGECVATPGSYKNASQNSYPVRVANGLVSTTCPQVPDRLLNLSPDLRMVYKDTKVATVEEIEEKPLAPVQAVQAEV